MLSCDFPDYLGFWREIFCHSTPVRLLNSFFFFLVLFLEGCFRGTSSLRSSATALDGEEVSPFFGSGTLFKLFIPEFL